jgi:hypothetical protein
MLRHLGFEDRALKLEMALDICGGFEKKLVLTGRNTGASAPEFVAYLSETMNDPRLAERWKGYQK